MTTYLVIVLTSVLVGLVAVMLHRHRDGLDSKVFLTAALINAGALLGILLYRKRRRRW